MMTPEQEQFVVEARNRLKSGCESYESVIAIARDAFSVIEALQAQLNKLQNDASEQSRIIQTDWVSPYEAAGLRAKLNIAKHTLQGLAMANDVQIDPNTVADAANGALRYL